MSRILGASRPRLTLNYGLRWEIYFPQYVNDKGNGGVVRLDTGEVMTMGQKRRQLERKHQHRSDPFLPPRLGIAYQITDKNCAPRGGTDAPMTSAFSVLSFGHKRNAESAGAGDSEFYSCQQFSTGIQSVPRAPGTVIDPTSILATQPKGPNGFSDIAVGHHSQYSSFDFGWNHAPAGCGLVEFHAGAATFLFTCLLR